MSTLSSQNGALQSGINHHMRRLRPRTTQSKANASGVAVQPRSLYFDVDTLGKAAASKNSVQSISKKKRQNKLNVSVSGPTEVALTFTLNNDWTVGEVKELIEDEEGFAPAEQRLLLDGDELEDEMTLGECVGNDSALDLELKLRGGCVAYEMHKEYFDDQFHIDFTDVSNKQRCFRGGASYTLPLGSMRYALKVLDKYGDNDWLGIFDRKTEKSCDGEWPVAYHGTTDPRAAEIVQSGGFDLSKGTRFLYGHGIYCTPDPNIALSYASPYKHNGKYYKLILQSRVDPSRRQVVSGMNYWIAKENDAIRPYGICVYPCNY